MGAGGALVVLRAIPLANRLDYKDLVKRLEMRVAQCHWPVFRYQLRIKYQNPNEVVEAAISQLLVRAYSTVQDKVCESMVIERLLDRLHESENVQGTPDTTSGV